MGDDRVAAVDDLRVVAALVEHADVNSQVVAERHGASHTALVRADDDEMLGVDPQVGRFVDQLLDELVDAGDVLKALVVDRVLHARIVRVER